MRNVLVPLFKIAWIQGTFTTWLIPYHLQSKCGSTSTQLFYRTEHSFTSYVIFRHIRCCVLVIMANTPLSLSLYMQVYLPTGIFGEGLFYFCLNGRLRLAIFYLQIMVSDDTQHTIQKSIRSTGADAFFGICGCDVLMGDKKTLCKEMWHHHIKWALVTTNMIIITASLMIIVIIIVFGIVTSSWGQHRRWKAKFQ